MKQTLLIKSMLALSLLLEQEPVYGTASDGQAIIEQSRRLSEQSEALQKEKEAAAASVYWIDLKLGSLQKGMERAEIMLEAAQIESESQSSESGSKESKKQEAADMITLINKIELTILKAQAEKLKQIRIETENHCEILSEEMEQIQKSQEFLYERLQAESGGFADIREEEGGEGFNAEAVLHNVRTIREAKPREEEQDRPVLDAGGGSGGYLFQTACPAELDVGLFSGSGFLMLPAQGALSAGTWSYPSGGLHLGIDLALPMYTPLRAPANGYIIYADAPVSSNNGFLGNYCGWPYGGGNTMAMLCSAGGQNYAVSFFHLSNRIAVSAGLSVSQGDLLAYSGNSGNSTGPHTHIEVFHLKCSLQEAASYFSRSADFAFGCGWSAPGTCSGLACRVRPESVF